jgi:hypothetical protein
MLYLLSRFVVITYTDCNLSVKHLVTGRFYLLQSLGNLVWCPYFWASEEGMCGNLIPAVDINSALIHNAGTLI